jgi:SAM-dependent MidA family methyltransferase
MKANAAVPSRSKSPASVEVEKTLSSALQEQIFAIHDIREMSKQERAE